MTDGTTGRRLLSVEEAAESLHISRASCFALIREGALTSVKLGRRRFIRPADLDEFVATMDAA